MSYSLAGSRTDYNCVQESLKLNESGLTVHAANGEKGRPPSAKSPRGKPARGAADRPPERHSGEWRSQRSG